MNDSITIAFEQILTTTVRMARVNLKAKLCVFLQIDDSKRLRVRAADGLDAEAWHGRTFGTEKGVMAQCLSKNVIASAQSLAPDDELGAFLKPSAKAHYLVVPVEGQSRPLGILLCGPFSPKDAKALSEEQLRSTGALCAVLTAHWRMYEWLSNFTPQQMNHDLRTPLTAVQGSIGMVLGGVCGQVGGEVREMLEMAQKGCERTVRTIEEYLNKQTPKQE